MFLTHMRLNPARRGCKHLLASPQRMHAAVLHGFPGPPSGGTRVLWRIDQPSKHDLNLLIVSPAEPDLTHVIEQAGWPTNPEATWRTRPYGPLLGRLEPGQRWSFRLRANTVKRRRGDNDQITTSPLTISGQMQWLSERADGIGIRFVMDEGDEPSFRLTHRTSHSFERRSAEPRQGREVTIASAQFDGLLEVADAEKLRGALTQGIGRAKAYGCGLLTLAAPRS